MAKNSCLFSADTVSRKPEWLKQQLALLADADGAIRDHDKPPATTTQPTGEKPANAAKRARRGNQASCPPQGAIVERSVRQAPLGENEGEAFYTGRVSVRVTSYRRRLLDPDNLCAKWFLDACRYSRLIRDDRPEDITFSVSQEKVRDEAQERTEILITPSP